MDGYIFDSWFVVAGYSMSNYQRYILKIIWKNNLPGEITLEL